jgi:protein involved in polysaccharide export with SLBB domain
MLIACLSLFVLSCASEPTASQSAIAVQDPLALTQNQPVETGDYVLQIGDVIEVKVYAHPDLTEKLTIRPDGKISLQLVDEVKAAGLTPAELDTQLTGKYSGVIKEPAIAVIVREFAALQVFIGGEVGLPGLIPLRNGLTCLQAIFQAGGYKPTAQSRNVVVLRNNGTQKPAIFVLDLSKDLRANGTHNDIVLQNKDIVFVPRNAISNINLFIDQYIRQLIPAQMTLGLSYSFGN